MRHAFLFAAAATVVLGSAAAAQTRAPAQQQAAASAASANQVICEKQDDTGSRLSAHKVCHTRSEWQQLRLEDRSTLEHVQNARTMDQNGH